MGDRKVPHFFAVHFNAPQQRVRRRRPLLNEGAANNDVRSAAYLSKAGSLNAPMTYLYPNAVMI